MTLSHHDLTNDLSQLVALVRMQKRLQTHGKSVDLDKVGLRLHTEDGVVLARILVAGPTDEDGPDIRARAGAIRLLAIGEY